MGLGAELISGPEYCKQKPENRKKPSEIHCMAMQSLKSYDCYKSRNTFKRYGKNPTVNPCWCFRKTVDKFVRM